MKDSEASLENDNKQQFTTFLFNSYTLKTFVIMSNYWHVVTRWPVKLNQNAMRKTIIHIEIFIWWRPAWNAIFFNPTNWISWWVNSSLIYIFRIRHVTWTKVGIAWLRNIYFALKRVAVVGTAYAKSSSTKTKLNRYYNYIIEQVI